MLLILSRDTKLGRERQFLTWAAILIPLQRGSDVTDQKNEGKKKKKRKGESDDVQLIGEHESCGITISVLDLLRTSEVISIKKVSFYHLPTLETNSQSF